MAEHSARLWEEEDNRFLLVVKAGIMSISPGYCPSPNTTKPTHWRNLQFKTCFSGSETLLFSAQKTIPARDHADHLTRWYENCPKVLEKWASHPDQCELLALVRPRQPYPGKLGIKLKGRPRRDLPRPSDGAIRSPIIAA